MSLNTNKAQTKKTLKMLTLYLLVKNDNSEPFVKVDIGICIFFRKTKLI